ncbi:MAG: cytochrome C [Gammaproteobacteria bacterium]|nr:cytochrome C [Gammaproteobacteria bacterium]
MEPIGSFVRLALIAVFSLAISGVAATEENTGFEEFSGYSDAPAFSVVPRQDELAFYPCSQCHEFMEPDASVRELMSPHEIDLKHGQGRFWCFSCHQLDDRDQLVATNGRQVSFNDAHLVCGGCHGLRHKDWYFGAHGKRQTDWKGERVIYSCTNCHDAHNPVIAPRKPMQAPGVRTGLERALPDVHDRVEVWERHTEDEPSEQGDHE